MPSVIQALRYYCANSLIPSATHLSTHSLISFIVHLLTCSFLHSLSHLLVHSVPHFLISSGIQSLTHLLIDSFILSLIVLSQDAFDSEHQPGSCLLLCSYGHLLRHIFSAKRGRELSGGPHWAARPLLNSLKDEPPGVQAFQCLYLWIF